MTRFQSTLAAGAAFIFTAFVASAVLADPPLLNVSYDPTRELYKAVNEAFIKDWTAKGGETVAIEQSHGGSGKQARAVIDASGTYTLPNPLGASGTPARGEAQSADRIFYGIADVLGRERNRYAGRRVPLVGSGPSAFDVLIDLARLALEGAGDCLLFGSGMGAMTTALFAMLSRGTHVVVTDDSYRRTRQFLNQTLSRYGIEVSTVPAGRRTSISAPIRRNSGTTSAALAHRPTLSGRRSARVRASIFPPRSSTASRTRARSRCGRAARQGSG